MIFHENRLLADDSNEISSLFFSKIGKMWQNLSSAAVVIGALSVKYYSPKFFLIASKITSDPTPPNIHGVVVQICTKYFPTGFLKRAIHKNI